MDLNRLIQGRIYQADLVAVDKHFSEIGITDMAGIVCLKNALLALANVCDFERTVRDTYKNHPELSVVVGEVKKNLDFAKYLRNKFVGHIHPELVDKAIEWKPELRYLASRLDDPKIMLVANLFLLETAINTYVDAQEKHKVFETETDLMYPPDWERFLGFLEITVRTGIRYLNHLCTTWTGEMEHPGPKEFDLELWLKAGKTKFAFLAK
jgi:hypothetical protein